MAESTAKKPNDLVRARKKITKFLGDVKNEVKKIVWPTPKSVFKNTGIVLAAIIVIGIFIFGLDFVLVRLLALIMDVSAV